MYFANLFPKTYAGDEVGTSLNTEAAVHKYYTEQMLWKFWKIPRNIYVVEYKISIEIGLHSAILLK